MGLASASAVRDCGHRNRIPKIHTYHDHLPMVLHPPQAGAAGHVHFIELDQFLGDRYLVSVHGPVNPAVGPAAARVEVDILAGACGRRTAAAHELAHTLVTGGRAGPDRGPGRPIGQCCGGHRVRPRRRPRWLGTRCPGR